MPRTWLAEPDEAEHVARLMIGFRNWYGSDWPSDNAFLAAAFGDAFAWTLGLSVLAFLPALLLPGRERPAG